MGAWQTKPTLEGQWRAGGKEEPGGAEGVEGKGTARHWEVNGKTRIMRDQGGAGGTREPGGA